MAGNTPEYPDSEIEDWNWDELEASPFKGVTIPIHPHGSRFYSAVLFSQVPKKCTDLDLSLLYNLILRTYKNFARKK